MAEKTQESTKQYLGDSVYAELEYFSVKLTTENGFGPTNTIVLEPEVLTNLDRYVGKYKEFLG